MHDLDEREANQILTRLHDADIKSDKIKQPNGKWSIAVAKEESITAIKYLTDARLFKNNLHQTLEKTSLVSSREDQRFYFERAISQELERTLLGMPGILEARVHLNLPGVDPILGNRLPNSKGSGSVLLLAREDFSANNSAIAELIAGAAGLEKSSISILVSHDSPAQAAVPSAGNSESAISRQDAAERHYFGYQLLYPLSAAALLVIGVLFLLRSKKKVCNKNRTRSFEENELYELARDFH